MKKLAILSMCLSTAFSLAAQKGLPENRVVTVSSTTNFAQHEDFAPSLISRLKTKSGWAVDAAAIGLGKPRMLCVGPNKQLYVTRRDNGDVLMLKSSADNHHFDMMQTVVAEFKGVHGIAINNGWIYLCSNRELRRYKLNTDGSAGEMEILINDLPDGGQHPNRTIAFGPDGKLYISVGSTCNDCSESNKESATLLRVDTINWKRTVFARGLRNMIGFDWHPSTKELWGMDNGSDAKGDNIPPEELNKVVFEGDYGWPLVYGKQVVDQTREDPPGATKEQYAKTTQPSTMDFPAHSAPIDFKFFSTIGTIPSDISDDALVTWHGSWNKKNPDGFKIQLIQFENGKPVKVEDFLSGFFDPSKRSRFGRPAGIAIAEDGAVYISDDANGVIYVMTRSDVAKK